jgi:hypothetical protein
MSRHPEKCQYFADGARVRQYVAVGAALYNLYPESRLLSSEIGGIGFAFHGKILDGAGLATPDALKYHPMKVPEERSSGMTGAIPVGYVREMKPELIVSLDVFIEDFLKSDEVQFCSRTMYPIYVESDMRIAPSKVLWNSRHLNVFVRKTNSLFPQEISAVWADAEKSSNR